MISARKRKSIADHLRQFSGDGRVGLMAFAHNVLDCIGWSESTYENPYELLADLIDDSEQNPDASAFSSGWQVNIYDPDEVVAGKSVLAQKLLGFMNGEEKDDGYNGR